MFERFTESARQVVVLAQEESRTLKHGYIGTEHLLLGLLRAPDSAAAHALESLDITLERVRGEVVRIVGIGQEEATGHIPFTPQAKQVLELALREALPLGHNYIGTEHILLGLISLDEGPSVRALLDLHVAPEAIREATLRTIGPPRPGTLRPPTARARPVEELFHLGPTSGARRLLMVAGARALDDGRSLIEPRDLLLALTRDLELGPLLAELGANEAAVLTALERRRPPEAPPLASADG